MGTTTKAIIIGAGIGGLAAGIALKQTGLDVDVFERAQELHEVGAGISLWANALHALDKLGLADAIRSVSVSYTVAGIRSWQGTPISTPLLAEVEHKLGVLCVVMHRAELLAALFDALGSERVHLGAQCVGFRQDAAGVTAEFAGGSRARGDVLIGADGLNSVVRAELHGKRRPTYAGYTAWRAVVPFDTRHVRAGESWGYGARFGQVPMSGGRVYWFATKNAPEGAQSTDEKAGLLQLFRGWHAPVEALIEATDAAAVLRNDIYDRPVLKTWGAGRVTLLGDAAHPMTPNLGQGGCQALEDAVVLAQCLREHPDIASALRLYEARRIPRANGLVTRSRQVGRLGQLEQPFAVFMRNTLIRRISPRLQAKQLEQIVGYQV